MVSLFPLSFQKTHGEARQIISSSVSCISHRRDISLHKKKKEGRERKGKERKGKERRKEGRKEGREGGREEGRKEGRKGKKEVECVG